MNELHSMPSIFTHIITGDIPCEKIWEDDEFFAFLDINPIQPGMTLLVPKKQIDSAFDMDQSSYEAFFIAAKKLVPAIQKATASARIGLVIEGLEVPHAHIKLIPISKPGDLAQSNAKPANPHELRNMGERIRRELSSTEL